MFFFALFLPAKSISERARPSSKNENETQNDKKRLVMTNEMVYQRVLRTLGVTEKDLLGNCRRRELVDARCLMAAMLMKQPLMRQKDVAKVLGVTQANVSKLLGRHQNLVEVDASYRVKWEKVKGER